MANSVDPVWSGSALFAYAIIYASLRTLNFKGPEQDFGSVNWQKASKGKPWFGWKSILSGAKLASWQYTVSPHKHVYLHCHIRAFVVSQGITKDLMLLEVNSENCMLTWVFAE